MDSSNSSNTKLVWWDSKCSSSLPGLGCLYMLFFRMGVIWRNDEQEAFHLLVLSYMYYTIKQFIRSWVQFINRELYALGVSQFQESIYRSKRESLRSKALKERLQTLGSNYLSCIPSIPLSVSPAVRHVIHEWIIIGGWRRVEASGVLGPPYQLFNFIIFIITVGVVQWSAGGDYGRRRRRWGLESRESGGQVISEDCF